MRLDRARRDAEHLCGVVGVEVKEQAQGNHLSLPGGQPQQRGHDPRIDRAAAAVGEGGQVRDRAGIGHWYLTAAAPPPRDVRVQRGAYHPRCWCNA
jgi:hypothetical protein